MRYTDIVFDIDGTMLDTTDADLTGLREALRRTTGIDHAKDALRAELGVPSAEILTKYGIPAEDIPRVAELWNEVMQQHYDSVSLFPGVRRALEGLRAAGVRLGIVTSKDREEYQSGFPQFGVEPLFGVIVTASDTELHKPFPDPLIHYLRCAGAEADRTLYVGDSCYDARAARAAGVDFALAEWDSKCPQTEKAAYRLEKPEDILAIVL